MKNKFTLKGKIFFVKGSFFGKADPRVIRRKGIKQMFPTQKI